MWNRRHFKLLHVVKVNKWKFDVQDPINNEQACWASEGVSAAARFVSVHGRWAYIRQSGSGPRVLLLHGNGGTGEDLLSAFRPCDGMTWLAPDRPGYGHSAPVSAANDDPQVLSDWIEGLQDALGIQAVHIVAHALAAGGALCFASQHPSRLLSLTLVSPFCRPTPQQRAAPWRQKVLPVIRQLARAIVPPLVGRVRRQDWRDRLVHILDRFADVPTAPLADEMASSVGLRQFNQGMQRANPWLDQGVPVVALFGANDQMSVPDWHAPWLREHVPTLDLRILPGLGHMLHQKSPLNVWAAVLTGMASAQARKELVRPARAAHI